MLLSAADGIKYGINGDKIKSMLRLYKGLREIHYGKKDATSGALVGSIDIDNSYYSVHELARMENELADKGCLEDNNCDCPVKMSQIKAVLAEAKRQVSVVHAPSIAEARGTKQMTQRFIEQWCKQAQRSDSYLLQWASMPEGQEEASFNARVTNFRALDIFLSDLTGFLKDFMASCPKACKQAGLVLPQ